VFQVASYSARDKGLVRSGEESKGLIHWLDYAGTLLDEHMKNHKSLSGALCLSSQGFEMGIHANQDWDSQVRVTSRLGLLYYCSCVGVSTILGSQRL